MTKRQIFLVAAIAANTFTVIDLQVVQAAQSNYLAEAVESNNNLDTESVQSPEDTVITKEKTLVATKTYADMATQTDTLHEFDLFKESTVINRAEDDVALNIPKIYPTSIFSGAQCRAQNLLSSMLYYFSLGFLGKRIPAAYAPAYAAYARVAKTINQSKLMNVHTLKDAKFFCITELGLSATERYPLASFVNYIRDLYSDLQEQNLLLQAELKSAPTRENIVKTFLTTSLSLQTSLKKMLDWVLASDAFGEESSRLEAAMRAENPQPAQIKLIH